VWCKLSGLVTEADWRGWTIEQLLPAVQHIWNAFGEDRLIFGSDWPVCLLAGDYTEVKRAAATCLEALRAPVTSKIWGANAIAAYQLNIGGEEC
jgi:L-fuconolactonase